MLIPRNDEGKARTAVAVPHQTDERRSRRDGSATRGHQGALQQDLRGVIELDHCLSRTHPLGCASGCSNEKKFAATWIKRTRRLIITPGGKEKARSLPPEKTRTGDDDHAYDLLDGVYSVCCALIVSDRLFHDGQDAQALCAAFFCASARAAAVSAG